MKIIREAPLGCVVKVYPEEAIRLIKSLSTQLMKKDSNVGREEFQTEENEYFTIAVIRGEGESMSKGYQELAVWIPKKNIQRHAKTLLKRALTTEELGRVCDRLEEAVYSDIDTIVEEVFKIEILEGG